MNANEYYGKAYQINETPDDLVMDTKSVALP
jgi:hypothetical protein